jgi:hypothetical protein
VYLSHSHELLSEQAERLKALGLSVRHIHGLSRVCPCLKLDEYKNELISKLVTFKIPNKKICHVCKIIRAYPQAVCPYKLQFKGLKDVSVVVAPIEYAFTNLLGKYRPNFIAVDDCLLRKMVHPSRVKIEQLLSIYDNSIENLQTLMGRDDYQRLLKRFSQKYHFLLKNEVKEVHKNFIDSPIEISVINPKEIDIYCRHASVHGFREQFATPALFPLFNYLWKSKQDGHDVHFKIIEAIPNQMFLDSMVERYSKEENVSVQLHVNHMENNLPDMGSTVYQCLGRKGSWYPTSTLSKNIRIKQSIKVKISQILKSYYNNTPDLKIGLIMPKDCDAWQFIPEEFLGRVEVLTWGKLKGKNSLEHCNPLFVIGTYNINKQEIAKEFSLWFARDASTLDLTDTIPHGDRYHYVDEQLENLRWLQEEYEQYQAIHRCRPLRHKREIFVFGLVPDEIRKDGLKVENLLFDKRGEILREDRTKWLVKYVKERCGQAILSSAVYDMSRELDIKRNTAYKEIKSIVTNGTQIMAKKEKGVRLLTLAQ